MVPDWSLGGWGHLEELVSKFKAHCEGKAKSTSLRIEM